jgi:hypothetical protein
LIYAPFYTGLQARCPSAACRCPKLPASRSPHDAPWFSRIRLRIAEFATAFPPRQRALPSVLSTSCCDTMPTSVMESCMRICCCWYGGNTSIMRSIVLAAPWCAATTLQDGPSPLPLWLCLWSLVPHSRRVLCRGLPQRGAQRTEKSFESAPISRC